jgi:hypothetical protein
LRAAAVPRAVDERFEAAERLALFVREEPLALLVREPAERLPARDALFFPAAERDALRVVEPRVVDDLDDFLPDVPRVDFRVVAMVVLHEED